MNKTIEDIRDNFYENIFVENGKHFIDPEIVKRLLNDMRDLTIDWAINNAICHKVYSDDAYAITQQEYIELYKPSLLTGKTAKELKL